MGYTFTSILPMPVANVILQQFKQFSMLPDNVMDALCQCATLSEAPRRKVLMQKGEVAHSLGLLLEGRLQGIDITLDGREAGLYFIEPFDFFGELSVIDQMAAPEFVIALSNVKFIMISASVIRQLQDEVPSFASILNARLAQRLRESLSQRSLLALPSPLQRICTQLLSITIIHSNEHIITDVPTHQELAIMINVTRETVTRTFQRLQKQGTVLRDGSRLLIKDISFLRNIADGSIEK
ncbi:MAG: helix-turn-helix domain-containing protein [Methylococcaceae bacterium]|nr:helix-turn-helix domain-containing protein [Methylococcaceae bacterium]